MRVQETPTTVPVPRPPQRETWLQAFWRLHEGGVYGAMVLVGLVVFCGAIVLLANVWNYLVAHPELFKTLAMYGVPTAIALGAVGVFFNVNSNRKEL